MHMYVCVYIYIFIYLFLQIQVDMPARMHACIHICFNMPERWRIEDLWSSGSGLRGEIGVGYGGFMVKQGARISGSGYGAYGQPKIVSSVASMFEAGLFTSFVCSATVTNVGICCKSLCASRLLHRCRGSGTVKPRS